MSYLPIYNPKLLKPDDSTFAMSIATKTFWLVNQVCFIMGVSPPLTVDFFTPRKPLTFGKNAVISIDHWWVFGVVAQIEWDSKAPIFQNYRGFAQCVSTDTMSILKSGDKFRFRATTSRILSKNGDKVQIGNNLLYPFTYPSYQL